MRPVMCQALTRNATAAADATAIAPTNAAHDTATGVRHIGTERRKTIAAPQTPHASTTAASRLLTDCHGNRSTGRVNSNGASAASRSTPTNAGPLATVSDNTPGVMTESAW